MFSYATRFPDDEKEHRKHLKNICDMLRVHGFQYEVLNKFNDFFSKHDLSHLDKLVLEHGKLLLAEKN